MECTKGKLETDQSCVNCIDILSKEDSSIVAQIMECEEDELSVIQRINAEELVRRWNAFEDSGIVEELRKAADEGLHECDRVKINCTCEHKDLSGLLRRIERIEAALAKS